MHCTLYYFTFSFAMLVWKLFLSNLSHPHFIHAFRLLFTMNTFNQTQNPSIQPGDNDDEQYGSSSSMEAYSNPATNFNGLPQEILALIFSHLCFEDQVMFSEVSTLHQRVYQQITTHVTIPSRLHTQTIRSLVNNHLRTLPCLKHLTITTGCLRPTLAHVWRNTLPKLSSLTSIRLPALEEPYSVTQAGTILRLLNKQLLHIDTTASPSLHRALARGLRFCHRVQRVCIRASIPRRRGFAAGGVTTATAAVIANAHNYERIVIRVVFPAGLDGLSAAIPLANICEHRMEPVFPLAHAELVGAITEGTKRVEVGLLRKRDIVLLDVLKNACKLGEFVVHTVAEKDVWKMIKDAIGNRIWKVVLENRNDDMPEWMWGFAGVWNDIDMNMVTNIFGKDICNLQQFVSQKKCVVKFALIAEEDGLGVNNTRNEANLDVVDDNNRMEFMGESVENGSGITFS